MGHSLENDLRALKISHLKVIDTAILFASGRSAFFKPSLRGLAMKHLKKEIQASNAGHSSLEDARTVAELVNLKLQNGVGFGSFSKESLVDRLNRVSPYFHFDVCGASFDLLG